MSGKKPSFGGRRKTNTESVSFRYPSVLLWGHTQVGKTSFLSSSLCGEEGEKLAGRFPTYDKKANFQNLSRLAASFRILKSGQKLAPTNAATALDFNLDFTDKTRITFQDIKGGLVGDLENNEGIRQDVEKADVLLCLIQWNSPYIVRELNAIQAILPYFRKKIGLVFTKAEKGLSHDDPSWEANAGWWKRCSWLEEKHDLIERFEERVWPVSCYGYQEDGTPSLMLGEYGMLIPYNVRPKNVLSPILWALETIIDNNS